MSLRVLGVSWCVCECAWTGTRCSSILWSQHVKVLISKQAADSLSFLSSSIFSSDSIELKHPQLKRGEEVLVTWTCIFALASCNISGSRCFLSLHPFPRRDAGLHAPTKDKKQHRPGCFLVCRHSSFHCCTSMQMLPYISPSSTPPPAALNRSFTCHFFSHPFCLLFVYCLSFLSFCPLTLPESVWRL